MLTITALYAGGLVILFVGLSANVIRTRRHAQISLGHGDHRILERRIRAHGNFAEYAPLGILMLGFVEGLGASDVQVHAIGATFVTGRLLHAYALSRSRPQMKTRVAGMAMTFIPLVTAALSAIWLAWPGS